AAFYRSLENVRVDGTPILSIEETFRTPQHRSPFDAKTSRGLDAFQRVFDTHSAYGAISTINTFDFIFTLLPLMPTEPRVTWTE
ncbi:MAG TPA: hypothetical protein VIY68_14045, partial [Steroidobacteraceae bacterium]